MENEEIIRAITDIFGGVDERNWTKVKSAMAEHVLLDYTSMNGGSPADQTPTQIVEAWTAFLPGFDRTHHEVSNFNVTQDGNTALVHYNGKGDHFLGEEVWAVEGTFDTALEKINSSWLVTKHKFNLIKQSGNTNLPEAAKQKVNIKKSKAMKEKIEFSSNGLVLVGDLYRPVNFDSTKKYPVVLVDGSWTTVKEQMQGLYAEKLANEGFLALAFDHCYFGESEGEPRFWENPSAKIADIKNAITYLLTVEGVDESNIFLASVCASSGYMAHAASEDNRVKALATIAAWLHDAESVKSVYGGEEGVQLKIKQAQQAKKKFAETGVTDYIPAVSRTDKNAAMFNFDYYLNPDRGAIPQWSADKFAVMSWEDWLTFDPMPVAKQLRIPLIMVHSDGAVFPDNVKRFFKEVPTDEKLLHWTEGTQFDFYDQPKQVSEAVGAISGFFKRIINQ